MTSTEAARDSIGASLREPLGLLPAGTKSTAATGPAGGRGGGRTSFSTPGETALETRAGRVARSGQGVGAGDSELSSGPRPQTTTPSPLAPPRAVGPAPQEEPRLHLRPSLGAGRSLRKRKGTRTTSDGRRTTRRRKGRPTNKMAPAAGAASAAAGGGLEAALAVAATAVVRRPGTESESMVAAAAAAAAATVATAAGTRS